MNMKIPEAGRDRLFLMQPHSIKSVNPLELHQ